MNKTSGFSHLDSDGKASMVDVSKKVPTVRTAEAEGFIKLQPETLRKISENSLKKGDVLATARIAVPGAQARSTRSHFGNATL